DQQSAADLNEAGLTHITAVSGLHCTFLIGLLGALVFQRQRLTAALAYPVLLFYMVMVGCAPPVVRSCVMVGLMLLAPLLGREGDAPTSLSAALLVILLANPFAIASVSLQFSFAAVAGLLGPGRRIQTFFYRHRPRLRKTGKALWRFFTGTLSASLGVMLLSAPLSAVYFGSLSLISPASNLLVLWIAPALFACALVGTVVCGVFPVLAPVSVIPDLLARYVLWVAGLMAKVPGHAVAFTGPTAALWLLLVYTLLGLCALSKDRPRKYAVALVLAAVCLVAAKLMPRMAVRDGLLTAVAVDVGQGASALLHSGDRTALVDCGSLTNPAQAGEAVAVAMDTYGWDRLDCIALTHYHADHAGGLAGLLARVEVDELLLPQLLDSKDQADLQREVLELAERYHVAVRYVEEPLEAELGGASLTVYPPVSKGDTNEEGLTILCSAGDFDLLITGDMNAATEKKLAEAYELPDIEVLIAGHHGSRYSTSAELLEAVRPEVGILSVGENSFGHPTQEAMGRMAAAGMTLYRTDWQGNILIRVHPETGGAHGG
ncbi:MAG: ComEC/Rec2 family competence protein, partial [Oscillospiraceae bacterium]|nr:ComEC/Rec2 family competence protein [Oscillospiraceae bacterium]